MGMTRYRVANRARLQRRRIDEIWPGKHGITADTAQRPARLIGTDATFWMNLQAQYDLETAGREMHKRIEAEVTLLAIAARSGSGRRRAWN